MSGQISIRTISTVVALPHMYPRPPGGVWPWEQFLKNKTANENVSDIWNEVWDDIWYDYFGGTIENEH